MGAGLPDGPLVAFYGDDFTGSAATMEALTFAGLPSALFFAAPTAEQLARFPGLRGIGIAGIARSQTPAWMQTHLPPIYEALRETAAPILHYKICSTFDSAPHVGSIGAAIDIGQAIFANSWVPLVTAAPAIHRYQAFGNLFATVAGRGFRLDRHPTMSRHPVTPMHEADLGLHLGKQTKRSIDVVDFVAMKTGQADAVMAARRAAGAEILSLDIVDQETLAEAGRLVWENREACQFAVGSQGLEYALIAYFQKRSWIPAQAQAPMAAGVSQIVGVSGSCSPVTAEQLSWADANGFRTLPLDATLAVDERAWDAEIARAVAQALGVLSEGASPILYTARGPDDPSAHTLRPAVEAAGVAMDLVNDRIGNGLGRILDRTLGEAGLHRGIIAGGDTSSHAALAMGVYALTAVAATVPGAALNKAYSDDAAHRDLELALKGGQMGTPDYFGLIRAGGRDSSSTL
ncbi:four-carbon acid sugar kinase family protein [Acidisoma cellulosilytica]|uniref:Four-carbon acid sugar kinase family protein n=2 Tax=Acidisoma cellulosilyticum TaxID=2802395 RepID=A0A963YYK7_9PROT|nr:four-carbon acid sugar kinase family protein [Acidisoma cellulosilyticum]